MNNGYCFNILTKINEFDARMCYFHIIPILFYFAYQLFIFYYVCLKCLNIVFFSFVVVNVTCNTLAFEPQRTLETCAPSEDSDQPGRILDCQEYTKTLIRPHVRR